MSDSDEELPPVKVAPLTEEDKVEKARVLKLWEEERMTLLSWRPFIGILAMHLDKSGYGQYLLEVLEGS